MNTATLPMKTKCVSPWAGGKRTLAPRIVELLGEHDYYAEVFVGGCSILPRKPRSGVERINDLNPKIVNVLTCIRDELPKLKSILEPVDFDYESFASARGFLSAIETHGPSYLPNPTDRAADQLIAWWMGPSGLAGTNTKGWFATRHTKTGGHPAVRWESFKASLPAHSERLQHFVDITQLDFKRFLRQTPDYKGVSIYVDPPYFTKAFDYECDFAPQDHYDLSNRLNAYKHARIVVSYYDAVSEGGLCDGSLLDELYPPDRWRRVEVEVSKASASASGKAKRATEVLLVNDVEANS